MAHRMFRSRQGPMCRKLRRREPFGTAWDTGEAPVVAQACAKTHLKCAAPCHNSRENTGKQGIFRELWHSARGPRRQILFVPKLERVRMAMRALITQERDGYFIAAIFWTAQWGPENAEIREKTSQKQGSNEFPHRHPRFSRYGAENQTLCPECGL